jgi:hypothetical protein
MALENPTPQDYIDLADDVAKAGHLEFYEDHGDRAPDGARLTENAKKMIEMALRYCASAIKDGQERARFYEQNPY